MLSTHQKETILRRAGIDVPDFPLPAVRKRQGQLQQGSAAHPASPSDADDEATLDWSQTIDALYLEYSAARAVRSLREAEEARQRGASRRPPKGSDL